VRRAGWQRQAQLDDGVTGGRRLSRDDGVCRRGEDLLAEMMERLAGLGLDEEPTVEGFLDDDGAEDPGQDGGADRRRLP